MSSFFACKNGQNISWTFVCDGYNQCVDGSDEQQCYCQGDIYACRQGNNVSCRIACATYGRVTCLTYQNIRACEQYIQGHISTIPLDISSTSESLIITNHFDALRYSACLAISILVFFSIVSTLIYLIRKNSSKFVFVYTNKGFNTNTNTNRLSSNIEQPSPRLDLSSSYVTSTSDINDLPPSYDQFDRNSIPINDFYEPPPYPGLPLLSTVQNSNSFYSEAMKTRASSNSMSMLNPMPLPEQHALTNIRTYCV
ncbi:unnamed protein product [Rotaria socialis]|uniref:Uncharacterized protein n=1 Tax=Rotaria socialis TaxID=392032 RepID=A0A821H150_9BILA|nr:unnamed protein product [Rotaria socialis]CAF3392530.1 unnamed protein product [Rotaria socialis]CAF3408886.1 unnamed protein product [Rotaria socialis]CAF3755777.1 unnamed protein product [Rotaria socialis]CAF4206149.1 unnamed protein product [Rotaria socialis]